MGTVSQSSWNPCAGSFRTRPTVWWRRESSSAHLFPFFVFSCFFFLFIFSFFFFFFFFFMFSFCSFFSMFPFCFPCLNIFSPLFFPFFVHHLFPFFCFFMFFSMLRAMFPVKNTQSCVQNELSQKKCKEYISSYRKSLQKWLRK